MADKWIEERERQLRERDWRRSEPYGRGGDYSDPGGYDPSLREDRSFDEDRTRYAQRDRVFGERESGASYGAQTPRGGGRSDWQGRDYGGTSPAFRHQDQGPVHGRQWQGRDYEGTSPAFRSQDYTRGGADYSGGGRYYGDDTRRGIYREEYGQGGREYGAVPRGYDARRDYRQGSVRPAYGGTAAGGTGGYDYERGYGDGGRPDAGDQDPMYRAGEFLNRAGQKISNWFRGNDLLDGSEGRDRDRYYDTAQDDWRGYERGHRGLGPKGYKRSDDRISDDVCERLADDRWLDASNIDVKVSAGEVTLSGSVDHRDAKHRAERLVESVSGVNHVQNNLRVGSNPLTGSGTGFGDSATEAALRRESPTSTAAETSTGRKTS